MPTNTATWPSAPIVSGYEMITDLLDNEETAEFYEGLADLSRNDTDQAGIDRYVHGWYVSAVSYAAPGVREAIAAFDSSPDDELPMTLPEFTASLA